MRVQSDNHQITARKLKILFIVSKFPYAVQTHFIHQMKGLLDHGHDLYILAHKKTSEKFPNELSPCNVSEKIFYTTLPKDKVWAFDIIYCALHSLVPHYVKLKQAGYLQGKIVTGFHGAESSLAGLTQQGIYHTFFKDCDLVLPASEYAKKWLISIGCDLEKVKRVYPTIDCSEFSFKPRSIKPDGPIRIVTTARLITLKGIEYAIKAIAQLSKRYTNIEYCIIGKGPHRKTLHDLSKKLGIQHKVKFLGYMSNDEVKAVLNTAHIFVLSSIMVPGAFPEVCPQALKEAMAMGLPVVGTYHGGIPEIITDGKEGFLVPEKDVDALAARLEYLIKHPEIWPVMGLRGRRKVEQKYEMEKENDRLEKIFQQLAYSA